MNWFCRIGIALLLLANSPAYAFTTADEQIDHYLKILDSGSYAAKNQMLERLQWSGLSNPRLFYRIETQVQFQGMLDDKKIGKELAGVLSHQIRALGYSGNQKYRKTLRNVMASSRGQKFRKHARKALTQLDKFEYWHKLIADSDIQIEGKSVEVATYMKMLKTDHVMVQRLAARAIFHERRTDSDLLSMAAEKLEGLYMQPGLDGESQDTVAWLCKALSQSGHSSYLGLLKRIASNTPHTKIKKHAAKSVSSFGKAKSESIVALVNNVRVLTEDQLLSNIIGNTLMGSDDFTWADYYEPSQNEKRAGEIRGKSSNSYSGRWKIAGSMMCFDYEGSSSGDGCWTLALKGDSVTWYKTNGERDEAWGSSKLVSGNPFNF